MAEEEEETIFTDIPNMEVCSDVVWPNKEGAPPTHLTVDKKDWITSAAATYRDKSQNQRKTDEFGIHACRKWYDDVSYGSTFCCQMVHVDDGRYSNDFNPMGVYAGLYTNYAEPIVIEINGETIKTTPHAVTFMAASRLLGGFATVLAAGMILLF